MPNVLNVTQALAKGLVLTFGLLAIGMFSLEGWFIAAVSFIVVKFALGLFLPVTDRGIASLLLVVLWLAVSAGFNPANKKKKA